MNKIKTLISNVLELVVNFLSSLWFIKVFINIYNKLANNTPLLVMTLIAVFFAGQYVNHLYTEYMILYEEANAEKIKEVEEIKGLEFKKIDDNLYTLTGTVEEGDCEKIVPEMPDSFTVILESPGGNLAEGSCLAAHFKLRNVVTVVRGDEVINDVGKVIYTPGTVNLNSEHTADYMKDKTMCASACGLMFLAGDKRYLIGDVYFGIHGPSTPVEIVTKMHPAAVESSAYKTASALLQLLERLEVDPALRLLFIQIPGASMYWLNPRDFEAKPELITIATNYRDFWDLTTNHLEGGLK